MELTSTDRAFNGGIKSGKKPKKTKHFDPTKFVEVTHYVYGSLDLHLHGMAVIEEINSMVVEVDDLRLPIELNHKVLVSKRNIKQHGRYCFQEKRKHRMHPHTVHGKGPNPDGTENS